MILIHQQLVSDPPGVVITPLLVVICVVVEWLYMRNERSVSR